MNHRSKLRYLANRLLYDRRALNQKLLRLHSSFQEVCLILNPGYTPAFRTRQKES